MSIRRKIGLALVATMSLTLPALTEDKKINRSDLPPAVEKTVAAQIQGATVRGFSEDKENGQTFYEAKLTVKGHSKDVLMDANGKINRSPGLRASAGNDQRRTDGELLVHRIPSIVGIVLGHGRCKGLSVGAEVFLVDDAILIHDKGHHARSPVLRWVCDKRESADEITLHGIVLCPAFA